MKIFLTTPLLNLHTRIALATQAITFPAIRY
jgi:hypothetical protein